MYDGAYPFINGIAKVIVGKHNSFIDSDGNFIFRNFYYLASDFYDGLAHGYNMTTWKKELFDRWGNSKVLEN